MKSKKIFEIVDGEYRTFHTFHKNGSKISMGFPKDNCHDKRIWAGEDYEEVTRLSKDDAKYNYKRLMSSRESQLLPGNRSHKALPFLGDSLECPKCGGSLVEREGQYGSFYGCSNFPKCRYTK